MTKAPVRFSDLFRYYKGDPHQLAAIEILGREIPLELLGRDQEWFKVWSQAGKSPEPAWLQPALKLIKEFEGCKLTAYPDPASGGDPWTIGWGTTRLIDRPVQQGDKITQEMADDLLQNEVEIIAGTLNKTVPFWSSMKPQQQAALLSFAYNLGQRFYNTAGFETISARLKDKEWSKVPDALLLYRNPGTPVEAGLKRRREAEGRLWLEGLGLPESSSGVQVPAGMVGPRKAPTLKPGDHHLIANDRTETLAAFTHDGRRLWEIPCLCRGQGADTDWKTTGSDTPPGLYKVGKVYRDYEQDPSTRFTEDRRAYGWYSFDLEGQEGQEGPGSRYGRDGIMIHGGGSACGWPGAWSPRQTLHPTLGCIRLHNADLRDRILPLIGMGRIWVSVFQEAT